MFSAIDLLVAQVKMIAVRQCNDIFRSLVRVAYWQGNLQASNSTKLLLNRFIDGKDVENTKNGENDTFIDIIVHDEPDLAKKESNKHRLAWSGR